MDVCKLCVWSFFSCDVVGGTMCLKYFLVRWQLLVSIKKLLRSLHSHIKDLAALTPDQRRQDGRAGCLLADTEAAALPAEWPQGCGWGVHFTRSV